MRTSDLRGVCAVSPTVVVGREVSIAGVDVVTTDEDQAALSAVSRLVELGHRRIAHISGGGNRPAKDRASALRAAVEQHGLSPIEATGAFTQRGGQVGARALLRLHRRPTAVIAANDLAAVGAIGVFRSSGLQVPDDISVIGYDDSQIAQLDLVQLTSVRQSIDRFGTAAISTLVRRIENPDLPRTIQRIGTQLVERNTIGPAPG
jgi:DNA-binding LacI/PurR family transcriptional regulator